MVKKSWRPEWTEEEDGEVDGEVDVVEVTGGVDPVVDTERLAAAAPATR